MQTKELQVHHLIFKEMKAPIRFLILAVMTALYLSCNQKVSFKEIELDVTKLTAPSITADGTTPYEIIATINPQAKDEFRIVTFRCNDGEFVGEGDKKTRAVRVNSAGKVSIFWKVPNQGGKYYLSASIGKDNTLFKDEKEVTLSSPKTPTLTVSFGDTTIKANGENTVTCQITSTDAASKAFKIETNEGGFIDGVSSDNKTIMTFLDKDGKKTIKLRLANKVINYFVKVTLSDNSTINDTKQFTPERANPDRIVIETSVATIALKSSTTLDVFLKRNTGKGKVSEDTPIAIEAYQKDKTGQNKKVGRFKGGSNLLSDTFGKISLMFFTDTNDFDIDLPIFIKVTSRNDEDIEVKEEITLTLTK